MEAVSRLKDLLKTNRTKDILSQLLHLVKMMSIHIKELRQTGLNQTFGLKQFKTQAGQTRPGLDEF
jgi:hypothetical protein